MFEFFDQVLSFLTSVYTFFVNMIENLILLFEMVGLAISLPPQLVGYMPPFIGTAVLLAVAIWVVKLIVGR